MSKKMEFKCHCGDWRFKNAFFVVDDIREKVCRDLPKYGEIDGKTYCVLHYPSKEKADNFVSVFGERILEEKWDFRMVYFPKQLNYEEKEFRGRANFGHAIFAEQVSFKYCKFFERFEFFDAHFLADSFFFGSEFHGQINFNAVDFREIADFTGVTFHPKSSPSFNNSKFKHANFSGTKFLSAGFASKIDFGKATFLERADFSRAEFSLEGNFKDAHFPKTGKTNFESVTFNKSVSFENVTFHDASFSTAKFLCHHDRFERTLFKNCKFELSVSFTEVLFHQKTDFSDSTFSTAHFERAAFGDRVNFRETVFLKDVFFNDARFGFESANRIRSVEVDFGGSEFAQDSRVFFDNTWFSWHTNFQYARFDGFIFFTGTPANRVFDSLFEEHAFWGLLDFTFTTISHPDQVYFQGVRLRPSWFVSSVFELREVNLADIEWGDGEAGLVSIGSELEVLEKKAKHNSPKLLAKTFRQIADNAESNNRFDEASTFRVLALKTEWLDLKRNISSSMTNLVYENEKLKRRFRGSTDEADKPIAPTNSFGILRRSGDFFIHGLYRITSFYGESWSWALLILLSLILVIFPIIYTQLDFQVSSKNIPLAVVAKKECLDAVVEQLKPDCIIENRGLDFWNGEAISHSLSTATLQTVEYRISKTFWGGFWISLEKIFAPLQAALLALAIRRKFMR